MKVQTLDSSFEIEGIEGATPSSAVGGKKDAGGFADALSKAVNAVDQMQVKSDEEAAKIAGGAGNLHEAALAMEKADVAMHLAVKVRNKIVEAYQEVMRMTV